MITLKNPLVWRLLLLIFLTAGCAPANLEPAYVPESNRASDSPLEGPQPQEEPLIPTPMVLDPGFEPTPTPPPLPAPLPTPRVTPIAIADLTGLAFAPPTTGSFWIYYWQGNEVWRMDHQGGQVERLLDTQEEWGLWLTAIPEQLIGTECCPTGPRVVVSPDGEKLALVVLDQAQLASKETPFTFSVLVFEVQSGESYFIGEGVLPKWSPDSQQLAYISAGGLWIADLESKQAQQLVAPDATGRQQIAEMTWLPSGAQIAYLYDEGHHRVPALWLIDTVAGGPPRQLINLDYSIYQMTPTSDGEAILFLSAQGSREWSQYHLAQNLWSVSLHSGELKPVTQDMVIDEYAISPDGQWLLLSGYHLYERPEETYARDLWLMSRSDQALYRLTAGYGEIWAVGWSPDGSRPLAWDGARLFLVKLSGDSLLQAIAPNVAENFAVGGVK